MLAKNWHHVRFLPLFFLPFLSLTLSHADRSVSYQFAGGGIATSGSAAAYCQVTLQRISGGDQTVTAQLRTSFGIGVALASGSSLSPIGDPSCGFVVTPDPSDGGRFTVTGTLRDSCEGINLFSRVVANAAGASFPECSGSFQIAEDKGAVLASGTMYFHEGVGTGWPRGSTTGIINGGRSF